MMMMMVVMMMIMGSWQKTCEESNKKKKKRKRERERGIHPENKYAEKPPDFSYLASLYPSFAPFVSFTEKSCLAKIDWTDFNATRELTRTLLFHDYGIQWWIPDGQLCPTIPNRANYIHWLNDLLTFHPSPWQTADGTWGVDIGTGANCVYPLLGASIHGWHFVGTDMTSTALEWAQWNVQQNPHLANLISIRDVKEVKYKPDIKLDEAIQGGPMPLSVDAFGNGVLSTEFEAKLSPNMNGYSKETEKHGEEKNDINSQISEPLGSKVSLVVSEDLEEHDEGYVNIESESKDKLMIMEDSKVENLAQNLEEFQYADLPVLVGVVEEKERFDFCMCNPPFFESMEEAGANPRTSCGGTAAEMVYPGGELAFITKIVQDSTMLKNQIHWFTTMVGRKVNIKILSSELRKKGVKMLRTTEFVQGRTSRWGLAWTFNMLEGNLLSERAVIADKSNYFFMLEGMPRHCRAHTVLEEMINSMSAFQVTCDVDSAQFSLKGLFQDQTEVKKHLDDANGPHFILSIFEQAPGTLLIKGILRKEHIKFSGRFCTLFSSLEQNLKELFCKRLEPKR